MPAIWLVRKQLYIYIYIFIFYSSACGKTFNQISPAIDTGGNVCIKVAGADLYCATPELFYLYTATTSTPGFYGHFRQCSLSTSSGIDTCTFHCVCPPGECPITISLLTGPASSEATLCEVQVC